MISSYKVMACESLKNMVMDEASDMKDRINALKALDFVLYGNMDEMRYDKNLVRHFVDSVIHDNHFDECLRKQIYSKGEAT